MNKLAYQIDGNNQSFKTIKNLINNLMYCRYIDVLSLEADRWKHCSHYS